MAPPPAIARDKGYSVSAVAGALKQWECGSCHFIYDEAQGWPAEGIAPGTRWQDVPHDWRCPDCSSSKDDFMELNF